MSSHSFILFLSASLSASFFFAISTISFGYALIAFSGCFLSSICCTLRVFFFGCCFSCIFLRFFNSSLRFFSSCFFFSFSLRAALMFRFSLILVLPVTSSSLPILRNSSIFKPLMSLSSSSDILVYCLYVAIL